MPLPSSLDWHVWSSSGGNNCHAVQRSLSSGASVYECIMGFYLVSFRQPSPPTRFLPVTVIGMCHFLPVHHFGMAGRRGRRSIYNIFWLFHLPQNTCDICHKATGLASVSKRKSTVFFRASNSTDFFKIPQILHARFWSMTSFTSTGQPFYLGFLFWYLWTTHPPCVRIDTCAQVCT